MDGFEADYGSSTNNSRDRVSEAGLELDGYAQFRYELALGISPSNAGSPIDGQYSLANLEPLDLYSSTFPTAFAQPAQAFPFNGFQQTTPFGLYPNQRAQVGTAIGGPYQTPSPHAMVPPSGWQTPFPGLENFHSLGHSQIHPGSPPVPAELPSQQELARPVLQGSSSAGAGQPMVSFFFLD
jgi:hypothetical protein